MITLKHRIDNDVILPFSEGINPTAYFIGFGNTLLLESKRNRCGIRLPNPIKGFGKPLSLYSSGEIARHRGIGLLNLIFV